MTGEGQVQRNPHGNFKEVEASRPDWSSGEELFFTKTKEPDWKPGQGATDGGAGLAHAHVDIDPYGAGRSAGANYKLLISAVIPRPIGFVSTRAADGGSTNLAPFSYTMVVNHDPPIFVIGYAGGFRRPRDSLANLVGSRECVINIVSEHFLEAANAASVDAPYGVSEWALTGLTPAPCKDVAASRVQEAIFSVECKLLKTEEFDSRANPGKSSSVLAIVEGVRFWAREDAINEEQSLIDPAILRPMGRLGGISYSRVLQGVEIPRPTWDEFKKDAEPAGLAKPKADGQ